MLHHLPCVREKDMRSLVLGDGGVGCIRVVGWPWWLWCSTCVVCVVYWRHSSKERKIEKKINRGVDFDSIRDMRLVLSLVFVLYTLVWILPWPNRV